MIICSEKKFVFIHVPRTGGRSISHSWVKYMDSGLIKNYKPGKHVGIHTSVQTAKKQYKKLDFFYFGFCRNPYDRMVSWYSALSQNYAKYKPMTFNSFVRGYCASKTDIRRMPIQHHYLKGADYVARFEDLQEEYDALVHRLELEDVSLGHVGKSKRDDWRAFYKEDDVRRLVAKLYQVDFKEYGYEE